MKKALKIILGIFGVFFLGIIVLLVVDISNDVEYKIVEEKVQGNGLYLRVTTEATTEEELKTIVEEIKKDKQQGIDATWLWIHDTNKEPFGDVLASARIPHSHKGQIMIGANNREYIFVMK